MDDDQPTVPKHGRRAAGEQHGSNVDTRHAVYADEPPAMIPSLNVVVDLNDPDGAPRQYAPDPDQHSDLGRQLTSPTIGAGGIDYHYVERSDSGMLSVSDDNGMKSSFGTNRGLEGGAVSADEMDQEELTKMVAEAPRGKYQYAAEKIPTLKELDAMVKDGCHRSGGGGASTSAFEAWKRGFKGAGDEAIDLSALHAVLTAEVDDLDDPWDADQLTLELLYPDESIDNDAPSSDVLFL